MRAVPSIGGRFGRKLAFWIVLIWTPAALLVLGPDAKTSVMPGPLGRAHASLARDCGHCHFDGTGLVKEMAAGIGHGQVAELEAQRCLVCHDRGDRARFAHGLDPARLDALREARAAPATDEGGLLIRLSAALGAPVAAGGELECSTCHREHRGREADLTAIADALCQVCHLDHDDRFPDRHPEFEGWPERRRTGLIFDHDSHRKHFPAEAMVFRCDHCHETEPDTPSLAIRPFAGSCSGCHHHRDQIRGAGMVEPGFALVAAFGLDLEALPELAEGDSPWPADGADFDQPPTALGWLLVLGDPGYPEARADRELLRGVDLSDLIDADDRTRAAARRLADATRRLVLALAGDPVATLVERLGGLRPDLPELLGEDFVAAWSRPALRGVAAVWFGAPAAGSELSAGEGRYRLDAAVPILRYEPRRHDDALLAGLHRLAVLIEDEALLAELRADGRCFKCHEPDRGDDGQAGWFRPSSPVAAASFLRFDHRPHLIAARSREFADLDPVCSLCHRPIAGEKEPAAVPAPSAGHRPGFAAMERATCARCHGQEDAPSSCCDCHDYHAR